MGHEASDFLRSEHRQVENHLDDLLDVLKHLSPERVRDVSRNSGEIHRLVSAHMEMEELVFYPALRSMAEDLVGNMLEQHNDIRETDLYLEELLSGFPETPTTRDTEELYRLGIAFHDAVQTHIVDEEEHLLKRVDEHLPGAQQQNLLAAMQRGSTEPEPKPGSDPMRPAGPASGSVLTKEERGMIARKRILIVRLGSMGDILHSLPVLVSLRESFPEWEIDWLVESRWRPLLEGIPELTRIVDFDTLRWRRRPLSAEGWRALREAANQLRERRYDCAMDLQASLKSAAACYLSGAAEIIGFETPWLKEPACGVFYTRRVAATGAIHMVEVNLAMAAALGAKPGPIRFPLPPGDPALLPSDFPHDRLAVINPGAGWGSKLWPTENYARVCDALERELSLAVVLNCGPGEEELAQQVIRACGQARPRIYSGSVPGLIALLRRSRLMVGPDTGPVHLAAALGVPTVGLFGPTDPRRNGPYGPYQVALRPNGARTSHRRSASAKIMEQILPDQVMAAVQEVLGNREQGTGNRQARMDCPA